MSLVVLGLSELCLLTLSAMVSWLYTEKIPYLWERQMMGAYTTFCSKPTSPLTRAQYIFFMTSLLLSSWNFSARSLFLPSRRRPEVSLSSLCNTKSYFIPISCSKIDRTVLQWQPPPVCTIILGGFSTTSILLSQCKMRMGRSRIGGYSRMVLWVRRSPFFILYSVDVAFLFIVMFLFSMEDAKYYSSQALNYLLRVGRRGLPNHLCFARVSNVYSYGFTNRNGWCLTQIGFVPASIIYNFISFFISFISSINTKIRIIFFAQMLKSYLLKFLARLQNHWKFQKDW